MLKVPDICFGLDSRVMDLNNVWVTSTLRGVCNFILEVDVATQGTHSGLGGGIIPDTWRIANNLINRLQDAETGKVIDDL